MRSVSFALIAIHTFAGEQSLYLSLELIGHVVDLDGPLVGFNLIAYSTEWSSLAVDNPVHGHLRPVAEIRNEVLCTTRSICCPIRLIVYVPDKECIVGVPTFHFCMEYVVFYFDIYPVALHICKVRFVVVVRYIHIALCSVSH